MKCSSNLNPSKYLDNSIANKLEKFNDKQFKHYTTREKRIRGMLADRSQHKETKDQTKIILRSDGHGKMDK